MAFAGNNAGRVNQSKYWALFGVNMVAMALLLTGGVVAILGGSYPLGLLMIAAIFPVGIYWRVVMMRRCRDIGWPASLPWISFVLQMMASFNLQATAFTSRLTHGAAGAATGSPFFLVSALALGDFVFLIVIGCVGTKQGVDYADVFGDGPGTAQRTALRDGEPGQGGPDRFDEAIARALEARRRSEQVPGATQPSAPAPADFARPRPAFGRRVV
jgi:uncharacterized membrane protein YhaH (DUF805 family)